jgi:hypothetical protein
MTKQEFWKMLGYVFENYDITCANCPACGNKVCAISCEQALKNVYEQLERESNDDKRTAVIVDD